MEPPRPSVAGGQFLHTCRMTSVRPRVAVLRAVAIGSPLCVALAPAPTTCVQPKVEGEVLSSVTGLPIGGVLIVFPDLGLAGLSDDFGYFTFESVPSGLHEIAAYRSGYTALIGEALAGRGDVLELHMSPSPIPLPGINVEVVSEQERQARLRGRAADLISRADVAEAGERTSQILDVIRAKAPPRLQIRQHGGVGGIVFCIQSSRRTPSVQELRELGTGCRPVLVAMDDVVVYAPPLTPEGGPVDVGGLPEDVAQMILRQNPGEIETIRILSPSDAFFRYGESGRLGAVEIKTRHPLRRDTHPL